MKNFEPIENANFPKLPAGRQADLFGGAELIALDILAKTEKNAGAPKKQRGYLVRCSMNYVRLVFP